MAPFVLLFLCGASLINPVSRPYTLWLLRENHPVEVLTFVVALVAGVLGLVLAWRAKQAGAETLVFGFYLALAVTLLVVSMEEVAWGQQLFGFDSPAAWRSINAQGETTLHNLGGLQGHSEIFRLLCGLALLAGVKLSSSRRFQAIAAPVVLATWAMVITFHAGVDLYNDYFPIAIHFDYYVQRTSELVELFIAVSGLLYMMLKSQAFSGTKYEPASQRGQRTPVRPRELMG